MSIISFISLVLFCSSLHASEEKQPMTRAEFIRLACAKNETFALVGKHAGGDKLFQQDMRLLRLDCESRASTLFYDWWLVCEKKRATSELHARVEELRRGLQIEFLAGTTEFEELITTDYEILRLEKLVASLEAKSGEIESEIRQLLGQKDETPLSWYPYEEYGSTVALKSEKEILKKGEKQNPDIAILRIQLRQAIDSAKQGSRIEHKELQYALENELLECQMAQHQYRSDCEKIYKKSSDAKKEYLEAFRKYLTILDLIATVEKSKDKGGIVSDISYQRTYIERVRAELALKEAYVTYLHCIDDLSRKIGGDITGEAVQTIAQCMPAREEG